MSTWILLIFMMYNGESARMEKITFDSAFKCKAAKEQLVALNKERRMRAYLTAECIKK